VVVLGVDFGTTNSAMALGRDSGVETVLFGDGGSRSVGVSTGENSAVHDTWPSLLFLEPPNSPLGPPLSHSGRAAIRRYFDAEHGRLIQSLKSYLSVRSFTQTAAYGHTFELQDLIALILTDLKDASRRWLGADPDAIVVGRPVHFAASKNPEDDAFALERLTDSIARAGLPNVSFEYEPVAAAYHYEESLDRDELILIGDFGGGTSDFCLMRVGPAARLGRIADRILGTDGLGIAGDAFDRQIVRHIVEPAVGRGTLYRSELGKILSVPQWLYTQFGRWHLLSFLKTRDTLALLHQLERQGLEPQKIAALRTLIENDAGYRLYKAVERAKVELSRAPEARFVFSEDAVRLEHLVSRAEFERWIAAELTAIDTCVRRLLAATRIDPSRIDRIFLTGGSSFVPAVRRIFEVLVGPERVSSGDEFTSVARGLARSAALRAQV